MTLSTNRLSVEVPVEDDDGTYLFTIPVEVTYVTERDQSYGADADGTRGVLREEVYLLDTAIEPQHLTKMTLGHVEYVIQRAWTIVQRIEQGGNACNR